MPRARMSAAASSSLAVEKIDPAKVEVNLPGKRLTYTMILQKVLPDEGELQIFSEQPSMSSG